MRYIKIVLTIIALLLAAHLLRPIFMSNTFAGPEVQAVDIVSVNGRRLIYGAGIPVHEVGR